MIFTETDKLDFTKLINENIKDSKIKNTLLEFITYADGNEKIPYSNRALKNILTYFYGLTVDTLSIMTYVNTLPQISNIKNKTLKAEVNKLIEVLFVFISNKFTNCEYSNLNDLQYFLNIFLDDENDYHFGTKILKRKIFITLCLGKGDAELKRLLAGFIKCEFKNPTNLHIDSKTGILEYFSGLDKFISIMGDFSISDISWTTYCLLIQKINKIIPGWNLTGSITGKLNSFMPVAFKYIIENTKYHYLDNINILNKYSNYLTLRERLINIKLQSKYSQFIRSNIFSNFPLNTHPSKLHLVCFTDKYTGNRLISRQTLINLNTENKFIKQLLINFINNSLGASNDSITKIENRLFLYFFDSSLYSLSFTVSEIKDFTFTTFKKQFRFFNKIDKKFPLSNVKTVDVLKKFYLFLLVYIKSNNYIHNIFEGTAIDDRILNFKNFKSRYTQGFSFVYHTPFEAPPLSDRFVQYKHR